MPDLREVINPSDKITIDYTDKDAARMAVLIVGRGNYGIDGEDGMPVFLLGGAEAWLKQEYEMTFSEFFDSVPVDRLILALRSISNVGERTSINDIVKRAQAYADQFAGNSR